MDNTDLLLRRQLGELSDWIMANNELSLPL